MFQYGLRLSVFFQCYCFEIFIQIGIKVLQNFFYITGNGSRWPPGWKDGRIRFVIFWWKTGRIDILVFYDITWLQYWIINFINWNVKTIIKLSKTEPWVVFVRNYFQKNFFFRAEIFRNSPDIPFTTDNFKITRRGFY